MYPPFPGVEVQSMSQPLRSEKIKLQERLFLICLEFAYLVILAAVFVHCKLTGVLPHLDIIRNVDNLPFSVNANLVPGMVPFHIVPVALYQLGRDVHTAQHGRKQRAEVVADSFPALESAVNVGEVI